MSEKKQNIEEEMEHMIGSKNDYPDEEEVEDKGDGDVTVEQDVRVPQESDGEID